jgi:glucose/arabinose dehydrogenase
MTGISFLKVSALTLTAALTALFLAFLSPIEADADPTLPSGFQESTVFSGLTEPTNVEFAPDGRVFVAEKSGLIKVFDDLSDTSPDTFADLSTYVQDYWDRGLLGLALDPNFPASPYVYVLYTYDHELGSSSPAPRWGDGCPNPPGATGDGCVVSGRLSRLQASGNAMTGSEKVLIEDWCQQYPSHSIGSLAFGADGALYVSGGDGASFNFTDYGQHGNPLNPCGDPPAGVGGTQTPPSAEGGALRSQDLRTRGDPTGLNGTILRVDPATGDALPNNPLYSSSDPNSRRVVASGLRNPFRITTRPGTSEVWAGDVGWNDREEINRITNPTASAKNFGWPCYEGTRRQAGYNAADLNICENLYVANAVTAPYYTYSHSSEVVSGETCPTAPGSSTAGVAFYEGGSYPADYDGALFFADYSRACIWAMRAGSDGLPDPSTRETFVAGAENPVDLEIGAGGDLFYADLNGGTIRRISYTSGNNQPPTAAATTNAASGDPPLTVEFDGSASSDPDSGDTLTYAWDLDGDGSYDDSTESTPSYTYETSGTYDVDLKVTDSQGATDTLDQKLTITVGKSAPPTAKITKPSARTTWKVGDQIGFSGSATDEQDGTLPASALSWSLILQHCPTAGSCHEHPLQTFAGVATGSFDAPDHEYPSYLKLRLTATDSEGLTNTKSVRLNPRTVVLTFKTEPKGLQLAVGDRMETTTFRQRVIIGSSNSVSAPSPQTYLNKCFGFTSWSDGKAQNHDITAPARDRTYTAKFKVNNGC